MLGASTNKARANDAMGLLEYGFHYFKTYKLYDASKPIVTSRLWKGRKNRIQIGVPEEVSVTVGAGRYGNIKTSLNLPTSLIAPYKKGAQIGTLKIKLNGKTLRTVPLIAMSDAQRGSFLSRKYDSILLWFHKHMGKS